MYEQLAGKLAQKMVNNGIIVKNGKELYCYGIEMFFASAVSIVTTVTICIAFKEFLSGIFFFATYVPLRTYAGGYHASTHTRCYLLSVFSLLSFLFSVKHIPTNMHFLLSIIFVIISTLVIFILAPVGTPNKMLDAIETAIYRKNCRFVLIVELLLFVGLYVNGTVKLAYSMSCSFLLVGLMLVVGKIMLKSKHI